MKYIFVDESWEDYLYWQKTDRKKLKKELMIYLKIFLEIRLMELVKPEPLKHKYSGFWSRKNR